MLAVQEPPTAVQFDLTSQSFKRNPFPTLAALRQLGPVVRVRLPFFGKVWLATTYDAVNDLLRDHQQFVQSPITAGNRWMGRLVRWLPGALRPLGTNMLLRDPPDHRRLRGLVDQAFQRQSVEALRPRLEALADQALERLAEHGGQTRGGVDLLEHFARPFPLAVICPHALVVSIQNGHGNVEALCEAFGAERVLGARIITGAELKPGHVTVTVHADALRLGPPRGERAYLANAEKLAGVLSQAGVATEATDRYLAYCGAS